MRYEVGCSKSERIRLIHKTIQVHKQAQRTILKRGLCPGTCVALRNPECFIELK